MRSRFRRRGFREEAPQGIAFLCAVRSRRAPDLRGLSARGFAATIGADALAFDDDDVIALCNRLMVSFTNEAIDELLVRSEGWPIACTAVIRHAALSGALATGAYERWRIAEGEQFAAFVTHELEQCGKSVRSAFATALSQNGRGGDAALALLETAGMFVRRGENGNVFYRSVTDTLGTTAEQSVSSSAEVVPKLEVRLFGKYTVSVLGRRVEWIRRRDADLFKFLALQPDGSATRESILATFWPASSAYSGKQSLRTSASNIRKALGAVVGVSEVERYFAVGPSLSLDPHNVEIDVRRFTDYVNAGERAAAAARTSEAIERYRSAEATYAGDVLAFEIPDSEALSRGAMYRAMYAGVLQCLAQLYADAGAERLAREYAERARDLHPALERIDSEAVRPVA